ncbi:MAG: hypothetical protein KatS3mg105_4776 [Gemmatales bacterium]|nr:MAG: hypothetical protein KatS3mg105_4776 [Gemmatales bacterium]
MRNILFAVVLFVETSALSPLAAQEWTRFRGPNGSGIGKGSAIPIRFSEADYNWKIKLPGIGHSSPILWGAKIFTTSGDEQTGQRLLFCIDAHSGKILWRKVHEGKQHRKHRDNSFASATPTADQYHVYVTWGGPTDYLVMAYTHEGKEVWRRDLGPYQSGHGFGVSPDHLP